MVPLVRFCERVIAVVGGAKERNGSEALCDPAGNSEQEGDGGDKAPITHGSPRPFELS